LTTKYIIFLWNCSGDALFLKISVFLINRKHMFYRSSRLKEVWIGVIPYLAKILVIIRCNRKILCNRLILCNRCIMVVIWSTTCDFCLIWFVCSFIVFWQNMEIDICTTWLIRKFNLASICTDIWAPLIIGPTWKQENY
jgi:hypothetical protein